MPDFTKTILLCGSLCPLSAPLCNLFLTRRNSGEATEVHREKASYFEGKIKDLR